MGTTNTLDLNNRINELEDAIDEVAAPRTATGTTLAQLADAIRQLTNIQKMLCTIEVLCSAQSDYTQVLKSRGHNNSDENLFNVCEVNIGSSPIKSIEFRLTIGSQTSSYQYLAAKTDGTSQADDWTITSWTLYYQGTPIS